MAVYRSDQAQLTFAAEAAQGADAEMNEGTLVGSGATAVLNNATGFAAGSRSIIVNGVSNTFVVGDFIRIGTMDGTAANTVVEHEIRRIESMASAGNSSTNTFILDRPTAFFHLDNEEVKEVDANGSDASRADDDKYITWIPGVYESIDTPDPVMSIEGRRFISTQSKRNWAVAYPGQQTLSGSVSGIVLLNGFPLRFPIGTVATVPEAVVSDTILINRAADASGADQHQGGVMKGDIYVPLDGADVANVAAGDFYQFGSGATSEVRKIIQEAGTTNTFKLNYPLHFDHADNEAVNEVNTGSNTYYEHIITETVDLDTVSWHVHMRESSETAAKDFDRRYLGGMIGSASITAEEGGMVTMDWSGVNFLNMVHNQASQSTVSTNLYYGGSTAANMPRYALMQSIDSDDVGQPGLNDGSGYPNTQPYYFSQGTVKFFGKEFARIRTFSLSIDNGVEPRYYIGQQGERARGPYEIKEGARSYGMSATLALPDASVNSAALIADADQDGALELFKQLLLEGDYGGSAAATARAGFTATIKFQRGNNDYIIIDIPTSSTAGSPTAGSNEVNSQAMFINTVSHSPSGDNVLEVSADIIFRSMKITIRDNEPVYP
jgi:hypothetical protein